MRGVWRGLTDADWRLTSAAYWAVISFLDAEVGRILQALREAGRYEDTIVIVTSDHGDMLGGHGLATKGVGTAYEEVYNIPLILRAPGLRTGEDSIHKVGLVDVAPTILDLCDAEPLPQCQGRSMRPVLSGASDPDAWQDAYAEFFGQRFVYTQRIVWHGDWKYVFSPGGVDELYNLSEDPHEEANLADDPECRAVLEEMCRRMWRRMRDIGDDSLFNTHYATLRTAPVGPWSIRDGGEGQPAKMPR
jgi:arylsulfatase A-like enzyme